MKKFSRYNLNRGINYFINKIDTGRPLKWLFIYGHHRGGTTYIAQQYLKVSKRGTGDWMMFQFAQAFIAAKTRDRQKLDILRLSRNFRKNLLTNSYLGGGQYYDIVIKQAVGTQRLEDVKIEIDFFTELFKSPPKKLFLYREPHGWWNSVKIKFGFQDKDMIKHYQRAFDSYHINGGVALEYGPELYNFLKEQKEFRKIQLTAFSPKKTSLLKCAKPLEKTYNDFKKSIG